MFSPGSYSLFRNIHICLNYPMWRILRFLTTCAGYSVCPSSWYPFLLFSVLLAASGDWPPWATSPGLLCWLVIFAYIKCEKLFSVPSVASQLGWRLSPTSDREDPLFSTFKIPIYPGAVGQPSQAALPGVKCTGRKFAVVFSLLGFGIRLSRFWILLYHCLYTHMCVYVCVYVCAHT